MYKNLILKEFNESKKILESFLNKTSNLEKIEYAAKVIAKAFKSKNKVISCGNGGSNCDAMHFAEELTGKYRKNRSGYPAIAISDSSYITCVGNDFGYESIFSRYIQSIGCANDVLFCISTSGKSPNILKAIKEAYLKNMKIIFLNGNNKENLSVPIDVEILVNHSGYSDRIQEIHIKIIHILILIIEHEML